MTTYQYDDDSVVVIIGSGAGGGTLANELCQKGVPVVLLEAGKRESPATFINDEWPSFNQLSWGDPRTTSGSWRIARDFPNLPAWICKTVGGTTTHWAGASLRLQAHEFRARDTYGAIDGADLLDWPLTLEDLAPYYARAEDKMGVTRTHDIPGLPGNNNFKVMYAGAQKLGYRHCSTGRMAINSRPRNGRAGCQQLGFCFQGCKMGAKWSTLYTEIPAAEATGKLELRTQAQVLRIEHDARGRASAVVYADAEGRLQRQKARVVAVAGNVIETPRILLNSQSSLFPHGLGNGSGTVGRYYMRHTTGSVFAEFEEPVHFYRGTIMAGIISDEVLHRPERGFAGGYEMETLSLGLPFMAAFFDPGAWGSDFTRVMDRYTHLAGLWIVGEDMPRPTNRITLNEAVRDAWGMPVANVHYDDHPNDLAMREHAYRQGEALYQAVGATKAHRLPPFPSTHNLGTCRMSAKEGDGVCNRYGQSHEVANLFISDGSQFTSSAAENPTLTIVSLAIRQAEYIAEQLSTRAV
ncbi:GMC family oxidoreductase [Stutzerimonas balearica]|uniref:GMC family oxidoreductase n=1 Tax=Stutzerimonas balearica TaxID=74829 RepID=UPI003F5C6AB2